MPSTKTRPQPTLTVETIATWRIIDDAPALRELAQQRRSLREQRRLLVSREREQLALLATAHKAKVARLAQLGEDLTGYPPFDPATARDPVLQECREQLMQVDDALLQAEEGFQAQSEPVIAEYAALQKSRLVALMDEAMEALETLEQIGIAGEQLCMQAWGCLGSYIGNIQLFARMQRRDRALLQAERDRLGREVEVFYG